MALHSPAERINGVSLHAMEAGHGTTADDGQLLVDSPAIDTPSFREFLEALGVAVYTTDGRGAITFYNEAAAKFWGRHPVLGELWCGSYRMFWPDGRSMPHDRCPMAIALREGRSVRGFEGIAERPDGSRVWFVPYPTVVLDGDGAIVGGINVIVDVTERRRAEQALRAATAVKDEFLGLVSHELRTPVTTIFGNAQLLRDRNDLDPAISGMVEDIATDAGRLLGVVENILLLTQRQEIQDLDREPQVLTHVVHRTVDSFGRRHPTRGVTIQASSRHLIVEADRAYLELLMENLLSNAHKYSPPGEQIEVEISHTEDEALVRVLDRGIGFSDDEVADLFSTFYRSEAAKHMSSGVGIGLSACRRVVDLLGGRIWGVRREDGGSEFGFALSLAPDIHD